MWWAILLSLSILFQSAGDYTVKAWQQTGSVWQAVWTITLCVLSSIFWMWYIKIHPQLAIGANIWSIATGMAALAIGFFMYHEPITTAQWIGMILGFISIALIL